MSLGRRVDGITFDVFSALFDSRGSLLPRLREALAESTPRPDPADFYRTWREAQLRYAQLSTLLGKGHTSFEELTRLSLVYAEGKHGVDLPARRRTELVNAWRALDPYPDVNPSLAAIRESRLRMALLSNGDRVVLSLLARRLGTRFDAIFSSQDAEVYKPHPLVYMLPVKAWKTTPGRVVHVAGGSTDALGAKSAGLFTVWVNRDRSPGDELPYKADRVIGSLDELIPLLLA